MITKALSFINADVRVYVWSDKELGLSMSQQYGAQCIRDKRAKKGERRLEEHKDTICSKHALQVSPKAGPAR